MQPALVIKRVYAPVADDDGFRVLVDRLWPRGLSKDKAYIDLWAKELAPSDALRQWFGHDPEKWDEFRCRYARELNSNVEALSPFEAELGRHAHVTLLYAAHDEQHNNAAALLAHLQGLSPA